jgi:hypothetical protein
MILLPASWRVSGAEKFQPEAKKEKKNTMVRRAKRLACFIKTSHLNAVMTLRPET